MFAMTDSDRLRAVRGGGRAAVPIQHQSRLPRPLSALDGHSHSGAAGLSDHQRGQGLGHVRWDCRAGIRRKHQEKGHGDLAIDQERVTITP